jgi:hypothetical protein
VGTRSDTTSDPTHPEPTHPDLMTIRP